MNADGYISTGQGILGNNMFAYCGNSPVNQFDPTGEFILTATIGGVAAWKLGVALGASIAAYAAADALVKNPPVLPSISLPKIESKSKSKSLEKDIVIPADPPKNIGNTYYHSTTLERALLIKSSGVMEGSPWEGGYVFAWKRKPSKYAIENSGARSKDVIISFKTNAAFRTDEGIKDPLVRMYDPVATVIPRPIYVWDVKIVEVMK